MATPTIKIDQTGASTGVAGQSRTDLALSLPVTLTDPANTAGSTYLWELFSKPTGSSATLSNATTSTATFTPDVVGSYLVRLTVNGTDQSWTDDYLGQTISTQGGCAILTTNASLRKVVAGETTQFNSTSGWAPAIEAAIDELDEVSGAADPTMDATYNQGHTITVDAGPLILDADVVDATYALDVTREPTSSAASGGQRIIMGANTTGPGLYILSSGTGGAISLGAGSFLAAGQKICLDSDADTYIQCASDDTFVSTVSGTTVLTMTGNHITAHQTLTVAGTLECQTAQTFTKAMNVGLVSLSDAASIATDASQGNVFAVTLGGNRTLANPTNLTSGGTYIWRVKQDTTGSRTLAYGSAFSFPGGNTPTLTTTSGSIDLISCVYDGPEGKLRCNFGAGYA